MLTLHGITKEFDGIPVLQNVNFSITRGQRVGLVGPNGAGKSTLLKIIAGEIDADSGHVETAPHASIGYLSQELPEMLWNKSVQEVLFGDNFEWDGREKTALALFSALGLDPALWDRPVKELSGGEKGKVALSRLLLSAHQIYLLDEPTNNLDFAGLVYLERFIAESKAAFVIVSHDRKLLDRFTTATIEIDDYTHSASIFSGSFTAYLRERESRLQKRWADYEDYEGEVKRIEESARRKKQWSERGQAKPRSTDNDKFLRGVMKDRSGKIGGDAHNLERRLERIEQVEKPREKLPLKIAFDLAERSGALVFEAKGAEKRLAEQTIGPLELTISYGDRVAILGPNGAGKTTLLRMLLGKITPDNGVVRAGSRLELGYLPQEPFTDENRTVLVEFSDGLTIPEGVGRRTLNRFGIGKEDVGKRVRDLSPGQRSRLILAKLTAQPINCLVLDEPSNHLDIEAMECLEGALARFTGTVVAVSHDRYFLDKFAPTRTLRLNTDGVLSSIVDYHEYEEEILRGATV